MIIDVQYWILHVCVCGHTELPHGYGNPDDHTCWECPPYDDCLHFRPSILPVKGNRC